MLFIFILSFYIKHINIYTHLHIYTSTSCIKQQTIKMKIYSEHVCTWKEILSCWSNDKGKIEGYYSNITVNIYNIIYMYVTYIVL